MEISRLSNSLRQAAMTGFVPAQDRKSSLSLRSFRHQFHLLVQIELAGPRRTIERRLRMGVTGVPAPHDAGWAEIDVLAWVSRSNCGASKLRQIAQLFDRPSGWRPFGASIILADL